MKKHCEGWHSIHMHAGLRTVLYLTVLLLAAAQTFLKTEGLNYAVKKEDYLK
jgi:hypothetical protein